MPDGEAPRPAAPIPSGAALVDALLALTVPHTDIDEVVGARDAVLAGERGDRLAGCIGRLLAGIGRRDRVELPPATFDADAPACDRYFYLYAAVAVARATRDHHAALGIPPEISRATMADIGRNVAVHRLTHGHGGFSDINWCRLHLTGNLYQVGRLQFERTSLGPRTAAGIAAAPDGPSPPAAPGDPAIGIHIPRFYGPMDPAACDDAIAAAHDFFALHYPGDHTAVAVCVSWLLDAQLAEYLPETSNIRAFAGRFRLIPLPEPDDRSILRFVFGDPTIPPSDLPRRTRLERAVLDHLASGRHWHGGIGWFPW